MANHSKITTIEEALLNLSEGLRSSAGSPNIKKYTPHEKQHAFHSSLKKKKLYIGGNRSGKTTGGVCEDIWRSTCRHPYRPELNSIGPNRGRVVAVDFVNGVEKIIFPQFQQWLYPSALRGGAWETAYDKFLRTLHFSNGSTIEFMSYDQDLDKFAGTSRHWVHFDEEPPKSVYIENMARLIDTDGDFWITMTPVEGMTWIYDDLYEDNHEDPNGPVEVIEVHMLENPFLSRQAIQSFVDSIDEDERQARLQGKFVQQGGRIYKEFDPAPGGLHVLEEPFDHPKQRFKNWYWICALDHGLNNPTAVLWMAVNKEGEIIVFDEWYKAQLSVQEHAQMIHKINQRHGRVPDIYVADPSIVNRNAVTMTSIHEEYARYGIPFSTGNNDIKAGIVRVKSYLKPVKTIRANNHKNGRPLLRITPNCSHLVWELKRYRWKTYSNKKLQYENNPFDEPHKKDDHACDALRYAIMTRPDLVADPDSIAQQVIDAAEGAGAQFHFSVSSSRMSDLADPQELMGNPTWREGNSIPSGFSDWTYDEHLGGIF